MPVSSGINPTRKLRLLTVIAAWVLLLLNSHTISSAPLSADEQLNEAPIYNRSVNHLIVAKKFRDTSHHGIVPDHIITTGSQNSNHNLHKRGLFSRKKTFVRERSNLSKSPAPSFNGNVYIRLDSTSAQKWVDDHISVPLTIVLMESFSRLKSSFSLKASNIYREILCNALNIKCDPDKSIGQQVGSEEIKLLHHGFWSKFYNLLESWVIKNGEQRLEEASTKLYQGIAESLINQLDEETRHMPQPLGVRVWSSQKIEQVANRVESDLTEKIKQIHIDEIRNCFNQLPVLVSAPIRPFIPTSIFGPDQKKDHTGKKLMDYIPGFRQSKHAREAISKKIALSEWYVRDMVHDAVLKVLHTLPKTDQTVHAQQPFENLQSHHFNKPVTPFVRTFNQENNWFNPEPAKNWFHPEPASPISNRFDQQSWNDDSVKFHHDKSSTRHQQYENGWNNLP